MQSGAGGGDKGTVHAQRCPQAASGRAEAGAGAGSACSHGMKECLSWGRGLPQTICSLLARQQQSGAGHLLYQVMQ